jgi:uncharacterized protein YukE
MSTLLEQAIIDATALKEAALKSAESSILEKYAPEVRDAVATMLEQEDDMMDMGMEAEEESDISLAAAEGEKLCPCPDDDEKVVVDFDGLNALMDAEPMGTPEDIGAEVEQAPEDELDLTEAVLAILESGESGSFDESADLEEKKDKTCPECKNKGKDCVCPDEDKMEEEIELTEDNIDALVEELVVDVNPVKRGWAGTPDSEMDFNAELKLAKLASTEAQEEIKIMKQALGNIKKDYAQLSESYEGVRSKNKRLVETVSSMKDKLEEVNLTNARLFYTNRVLNSNSLNERQKTRIAEAISESRSVNEAKIVFETLQNAVGSSTKKTPKSLSEAINRTSPLMARRESSSSATTPAVERMQRLAGINKK